MPRTIKIAVIGCGRQADLAFFPWIKAHRGAELAAVADLNADLAARAAVKYGARKFTDWRDMFGSCKIDAVIICAPPWAHAEPAIAACGLGINVLCEKPMASSVEDCRAMLEATERNGVLMQIGFSLRYDPGYEAMKKIIKTGEIGRLFQLRSTYDGWVPDLTKPFFKEGAALLEKTKIFPPGLGAWRMNDPRTGGVYNDHSIHYIDMFRWIMEEEAVSVSGVAQKVVESRINEDHASSILKFEGGACAYIQSSQCRFSARGSRDEGLIHGADGCVKYKMDQSWYMLGFPHIENVHAKVWKFGAPSFILNRFLPVTVPHGKNVSMFKRQLDDFVSRLNGTHEPHPVFGDWWGATAKDGLKSVQIVDAFYKSSDTNSTITLE